jgi:hypothetical protein
MKYYIDTEFIEMPNFIELISLGIKCEDGRTFYAESTCFDERKASQWVKENVISKLRWYGNPNTNKGFCNVSVDVNNGITEVFGTLDVIRDSLLDFIDARRSNKPEFWGYYADYDWVVFCWIFGSMMDLPEHFPMYCKDLKQLMDEIGIGSIPGPENEHDALADAIWNEKLHKYLI